MSSSMTEREQVQSQYSTAANLCTRISFHDRYSVNKQGFGNWIFERYRLQEGDMGCLWL